MARGGSVGTKERIAGYTLIALAMASAFGGIAARRLVAAGVMRTLATAAVPWAVTAVAAAAPETLLPAAVDVLPSTGDAGATSAPLADVERFARLFWDDRDGSCADLMTPTMHAALPAERREAIRAQLTGANGALTEIGAVWLEDHVQGFDRYRVPHRFETGRLDMRVVLDTEGLVAGLFFVAHLDPPREITPPASIDEKEIRIGPVGSGLPGTLALPVGDGPFPAIVLVHGSGPNDRDETVGPNKPFRDLAWGLAERGIAVLRYDKRSFARPDSLIAIGDRLTVREEVIDDARLALSLLRRRPEVDANRVFVLGHSLGGTLAPRIAAASPRPAGLVVLAGSTLPLPEKILSQIRTISLRDGTIDDAEQIRIDAVAADVHAIRRALDGDAEPPDGAVLGAPFGYYRDLERHDPATEAVELGLPILVAQGGRDYQVTLVDFERWYSALHGRPGACLVVHDSLDHLFRPGDGPSSPDDYERPVPVAEELIDQIASWIRHGTCPSPETRDKPA